MVRGDLVGGLKIALSKGKSLQDAMQSFYNAGYPKEDIEAAARALKEEGFQARVVERVAEMPKVLSPTKPLPQPKQTPVQKEEVSQQKIASTPVPPEPKKEQPPLAPKENLSQNQSFFQQSQPTQQHTSSYETEPKKKIDKITIVLILILVVLLGILFSVFFFKASIVEFLNNILE